MSTSFTEWLRAQAYRNDLVGELAEQAVQSADWPRTNTLLALKVYLHLREASTIAMRALQLAHEEWDRSRHVPTVNMWIAPSKGAN